jgi:acyl-coenzyme A synthetase/AMP-(fatty) acid ligase
VRRPRPHHDLAGPPGRQDPVGDELAAFLRDGVARFKIPVAWRFVDAVPMTASGKVRRFVVRDETNDVLGIPPLR